MVLSVVLFSLMVLIRHAYRLHDTMTGTMILEEITVCAANDAEAGKEMTFDAWAEALEARGELLGNPRLWLGEYRIDLKASGDRLTGTAAAGDWTQEIEMERFRPGRFLRRVDALIEIGKGRQGDENGIQTGDEPELHGRGSDPGMP